VTVPSIADIRRDYRSRALAEGDVAAEPIAQFRAWFDEAVRADLLDVNAMTLATADAHGRPDARTVLLKDVDADGFVFFTNYDSAKGRQLAANPRGCLLFFWAELERQVRINGAVTKTTAAESDQYFHSRPIESQIGAAISDQIRPIEHRSVLERKFEELVTKYKDAEVPRPANWGGYRLTPDAIEFWQGRKSRLHDRLLYTRQADGSWTRSRLAP
jgi:pyridoxamine 5'-phosphate oxidase